MQNTPIKTRTGVICPWGTSLCITSDHRLEETLGLCKAIDLEVVLAEAVKLRCINAGTYLGSGVIKQLAEKVAEQKITLLVVDADISPIQQRNLEKALNLKIIDRTALILEIFGERAQTREGCLQVELAHLTYQRSRLVRSWTHLERQRGGAGFLGGPGETQIELDRRIIDDKIVKIKKSLEKIKQTRGLQRVARKKVPYPIVALVGYTNTGKSTLFNRLTQAEVFAADLLFATLDTTMRRLTLPSGREVILSDTVGFISDLPHELIMAFRATLEEVLEADVIIQVIDASNPNRKEQRGDVLNVLHGLGLEQIEHHDNYIEVYNKTDLLEDKLPKGCGGEIATSALSGEGCDKLLHRIDRILDNQYQIVKLKIAVSDGKTWAWIHRNAEVISQKNDDQNISLEIKISSADYGRLQKIIS